MVGRAARTMAAEGTLRATPLLELRRDARAAIFIAYHQYRKSPSDREVELPPPRRYRASRSSGSCAR